MYLDDGSFSAVLEKKKNKKTHALFEWFSDVGIWIQFTYKKGLQEGIRRVVTKHSVKKVGRKSGCCGLEHIIYAP